MFLVILGKSFIFMGTHDSKMFYFLSRAMHYLLVCCFSLWMFSKYWLWCFILGLWRGFFNFSTTFLALDMIWSPRFLKGLFLLHELNYAAGTFVDYLLCKQDVMLYMSIYFCNCHFWYQWVSTKKGILGNAVSYDPRKGFIYSLQVNKLVGSIRIFFLSVSSSLSNEIILNVRISFVIMNKGSSDLQYY